MEQFANKVQRGIRTYGGGVGNGRCTVRGDGRGTPRVVKSNYDGLDKLLRCVQNPVKENNLKVGWACGTHGRDEHTGFWWENQKEKRLLRRQRRRWKDNITGSSGKN
jgi:hypothetical protein